MPTSVVMQAGAELEWLESLRPGVVTELFEFVPNLLYFAKDRDLRLMAGNRAFVRRCGFENERELIGRTDREIFAIGLAEKFSQDDRQVVESGEALTGIVELFPNSLGELEWYITDKIPLFDQLGRVAGLCGMVRTWDGVAAENRSNSDLVSVTDYLKRNFAGKVSVAELARRAHTSVRQLERRFGEAFKTSPRQYVIKLRILEACELLANSSLTLTEIAHQVGFYDQSSFSRKFSEMMGTSPRAYRKSFATRGPHGR